jgi:hypothetical protein
LKRRSNVRVFFFLLLSGLAHFVLARWIVSAWPSARRRSRQVYLVAAGCSVVLGGLRVVASVHDTELVRGLVAAAFVELAIVMLGLVPIGLVVLVARSTEMVVSLVVRPRVDAPPAGDDPPPSGPRPAAAPSPADLVSRRQAMERIAGTAAFGSATMALGWGIARGRHAFEIEEVAVKVAGWPRALDGYTIAQVSDVHVGFFVGDRELDEGFELVRRIRADLVVATGDLVDFQADRIGLLARRLAAVPARDGAFAIPGNHDHYAGPAAVVAGLRSAGVRVLCNEGVRLREADGGGFALLGVDDLQGRRSQVPGYRGPDLGRAIAMTPPDLPRVLLAHQPTYFLESAGRVALQLSGHTHGGQINPGFTPARMVMQFIRGRYQREGSTLWVNRGFGVAGPPARIGSAPEVTKIVIVSG